MPTLVIPEFTIEDNMKSIILYLDAMGTAANDLLAVNEPNPASEPSPKIIPNASFIYSPTPPLRF